MGYVQYYKCFLYNWKRLFENYFTLSCFVFLAVFDIAIISVDTAECPIFRSQPCTPNEYTVDNLMSTSRRQESTGFIIDNFQLTDSHMNPSIIRDPGLIRAYDKIIMIWRMPDRLRRDKVGYNVLDSLFRKVKANDMMEIFYPNDHGDYLIAEDARIFSWNGQLYVCYNHHHTERNTYHWYTQYYNPVFYSKEPDQFYAKWHLFKFNIEQEVGREANKVQKNWMPFEYCPKCEYKHGSVSLDFVRRYRKEVFSMHHHLNNNSIYFNGSNNDFNSNGSHYHNFTYHNGHSKSHHKHLHILINDRKHALEEVISSRPVELKPATLLWIKDIDPHRIVTAVEVNQTSIDSEEEVEIDIYMKSAYVTKLEKEAYEVWPYGEMRGGTPALLVNKTHFITFFHSSGYFQFKSVKTYYMGAYIFENKPPFGISGISPEPIAANAMYNESFGGWTRDRIDYVVFPMGVVMDDEKLYVSYGKNDYQGWLVILNKTQVLNSLKPVKYKILKFDNMSHII